MGVRRKWNVARSRLRRARRTAPGGGEIRETCRRGRIRPIRPVCPMLLACLADDFTGATDALETLTCAGLRTAMFTAVPSPEEMRGLQAVVVASPSRSWTTAEMERVRPLLQALRGLRPRHVFYKVCSTFDSSPGTGSIGRVIDIGTEVFGQE